jgi:hypothetical protein
LAAGLPVYGHGHLILQSVPEELNDVILLPPDHFGVVRSSVTQW